MNVPGPTLFLLCSTCLASLPAQGFVTSPIAGTPQRRIGDVTGDGREDLLVVSAGAYQVIDSANGLPISFLARPAGGQMNFTYTPIGDYDGDGKDDLAYWAPLSPSNPLNSATVVSGADGSTLLTLPGPLAVGNQDGFGMNRGGDFDGDGRCDLFVVVNGEAKVLSARTGAVLAQWVPTPPPTNTYLGIEAIGDENGDGRDDALLVYSDPALVSRRAIVRAPGVLVPHFLYRDCGDVTGDGKVDFFGANTIVAGGTLTTAWTAPLSLSNGCFGLGDVDGDGYGDFAIGYWTPIFQRFDIWSGATLTTMPGGTTLVSPKALGDLDGDGRVECVANAQRFEWTDPIVPVASRMIRRGTAGTTNDGRKPTLVARGHCGLGHAAFFDMRGGLPNGITALFYGNSLAVDLAPIGAPGNACYTDLLGAFAFVADAFGVAQYQVTMPTSPVLFGAALSLQAVVVDPAANALGLVTSNAIDVETNN